MAAPNVASTKAPRSLEASAPPVTPSEPSAAPEKPPGVRPQVTWPLPDEVPPPLRAAPSGVFFDGSVLLLAGSTNGALPLQTHQGGDDAFVVRLHPGSGAPLFTHQFGTTTRDVAVGVEVSGTSFVVAGTTSGELQPGGVHGSRDGFIEKRTLDGKSRLWLVQLGTTESDEILGIQVDEGGHVYVAGTTKGAFETRSHIGRRDVFVQKYSPDGKVLWTTQLGTSEDDDLLTLRLGPSATLHLLTSHASGGHTFNRITQGIAEERFQALISLDRNTGSSRGGLLLSPVKKAAALFSNGKKLALRWASADPAQDFALSDSGDWLLATSEFQTGGTGPSHDGNAPTVQRIQAAGRTLWEHDFWEGFSTMIRTVSSSVTGETGGYVFESGIDAYRAEQIYLRKLRARDGHLVYRANFPGYAADEGPGPIVRTARGDVVLAWGGEGPNASADGGETTQVVLADGSTGAVRFQVSLGAKRTEVEAELEPDAPVEFCGMTYPVDQEVTHVMCSRRDVVDLRPLARLKNLETLWLSHTHVADLSEMKKLSTLRSLRLEQCEINNIASLSGLENLEELFLAGNDIMSLEPLSALKNLEEIDLSGNPSLGSLSPLSKLPTLTKLSLRNARELELAPLSALPSVTHLDLAWSYRVNLESLERMKALQFVDLTGLPPKDVTRLAEKRPDLSLWDPEDESAPEDSSLESEDERLFEKLHEECLDDACPY